MTLQKIKSTYKKAQVDSFKKSHKVSLKGFPKALKYCLDTASKSKITPHDDQKADCLVVSDNSKNPTIIAVIEVGTNKRVSEAQNQISQSIETLIDKTHVKKVSRYSINALLVGTSVKGSNRQKVKESFKVKNKEVFLKIISSKNRSIWDVVKPKDSGTEF